MGSEDQQSLACVDVGHRSSRGRERRGKAIQRRGEGREGDRRKRGGRRFGEERNQGPNILGNEAKVG